MRSHLLMARWMMKGGGAGTGNRNPEDSQYFRWEACGGCLCRALSVWVSGSCERFCWHRGTLTSQCLLWARNFQKFTYNSSSDSCNS